jgi:hypothetical protein
MLVSGKKGDGAVVHRITNEMIGIGRAIEHFGE